MPLLSASRFKVQITSNLRPSPAVSCTQCWAGCVETGPASSGLPGSGAGNSLSQARPEDSATPDLFSRFGGQVAMVRILTELDAILKILNRHERSSGLGSRPSRAKIRPAEDWPRARLKRFRENGPRRLQAGSCISPTQKRLEQSSKPKRAARLTASISGGGFGRCS